MWRMTTEIFNHLKEGGNRINKRKWICRIHGLDWVSRGIIFWLRFRHGKWKTYRVI